MGAMEGLPPNGIIPWVSIQGLPGAMQSSSQPQPLPVLQSPHQTLDT